MSTTRFIAIAPPTPSGPTRRRAGAIADRRGSTSLMFAAAATALFGFAALATEGGSLYLARRQAQSAADMAAMAAANVKDGRSDSTARIAARTIGLDVASRNGFAASGNTSVTINSAPDISTGPNRTEPTAVEALVRRRMSVSLAAMFTGEREVEVATRAVALLLPSQTVCILGQTQVRMVSGSSYVFDDCTIASNGTGAQAVRIESMSGTGVTADTIRSVGTCSGCNAGTVHLDTAFTQGAPPVPNPYAYLDGIVAPSIGCSGGTILREQTRILTRASFNPSMAFCGQDAAGLTLDKYPTVKFASETNFPMTSGTYYFHNVNLMLESTTNVSCAACTFVFTGTTPGTLLIKSNTNLRLTAPSSASAGQLQGMLFVRTAAGASGTQGYPGVDINSNTDLYLKGGQYFGMSYTRYHSNSHGTEPLCNAMVGGILDFDSASNLRVDISGCAALNTRLPQVRQVRLVE